MFCQYFLCFRNIINRNERENQKKYKILQKTRKKRKKKVNDIFFSLGLQSVPKTEALQVPVDIYNSAVVSQPVVAVVKSKLVQALLL